MTEFNRKFWRIARIADESERDELGNSKAQLQILAAVRLLSHPIDATQH